MNKVVVFLPILKYILECCGLLPMCHMEGSWRNHWAGDWWCMMKFTYRAILFPRFNLLPLDFVFHLFSRLSLEDKIYQRDLEAALEASKKETSQDDDNSGDEEGETALDEDVGSRKPDRKKSSSTSEDNDKENNRYNHHKLTSSFQRNFLMVLAASCTSQVCVFRNSLSLKKSTVELLWKIKSNSGLKLGEKISHISHLEIMFE